MKVYVDKLLAEAVPDGSFGGARPTRRRPAAPRPDPQAAEHCAELVAELSRLARRKHTDRCEAT